MGFKSSHPVSDWDCLFHMKIGNMEIYLFEFFKCLKSSRNVRFDRYRGEGNPLFTFNVVKLVLLWHKLYH